MAVPRGYVFTPVEDRFAEKYMPVPWSGCWIWTGALDGLNKYGAIYFKGRDVRAHRLSWEIHHGPIPAGVQVLHKCDVPQCVNPDHLFLGDQKENMADMIAKRRHYWADYTPKSVCRNGHEYTEENTYISPRGVRQCRACKKKDWENFTKKGPRIRNRTGR